MTTPGAPVYEYGIDDPIRQARTITIESEAEAREVYEQGVKLGRLPTGYIVRAVVRCNQLDTFRMIACDWSRSINSRHENVELYSRRLLGRHLRAAHPYLDSVGRSQLQHAIVFNLRDVGR